MISPETIGQLRLLWTLDEPGNPNAQEGCFLTDCWRMSRIGNYALSPDEATLAVGVCLTDPTVNTSNPRLYAQNCPGKSEVRLYDSGTGELRQSLAVDDFPLSMAFHPNGTILAVGMAHRTIEVWDLGAGEQIHTLYHSTKLSGVVKLAFSSDGELLISFGDDVVQLWDWNRAILRGAIEHALYFSLDPAGGRLATLFLSMDNSYYEVRFYPFDNLEAFRAFRIDWRISPYWLNFTPDGSRVVVFGDRGVEVHDPSSGQATGKGEFEDLFATDAGVYIEAYGGFTPDGHQLLLFTFYTDTESGMGLGFWVPLEPSALVSWFLPDAGLSPTEDAVAQLLYSDRMWLGPTGRILLAEEPRGRVTVWAVDPAAPAVEPECVGACSP
jgi:hypothetical protein